MKAYCTELNNAISVHGLCLLIYKSRYHESLTILFSRLLVSETKESGRLIMHKLIQTTIENRLTSEETLSFFATALQLINASFPAQENGERLVNRWQQCTQFLPHVLRLLSIYKGSSHEGRLRESYVFGDLLERAAWCVILNTMMSLSNNGKGFSKKEVS